MLTRAYFVYLVTNKPNGVLYLGVTNDLIRRVWEHKQGLVDGFSKTYQTKQLVWFEQYDLVETAILREKQLKKWKRLWKVELILANNPEWIDLYNQLI